MYSSEDLERVYFQYQTEVLPHGESPQSFCSRNKIPYNIFQKWYKDTRNQIVEVKVDGFPATDEADKPISSPEKSTGFTVSPTRLWINLRISNRLYLSRKNLNYQNLVLMVEKLEGLY